MPSTSNTALYIADAAWRSLAFDTPQKPFAIMRIEETLSFLEELKTQQAVDGCETPYVYLTGTEYTELNQAFNKGDIDLISFASQPIRFSHVSRDLRENMKDLFDGYKKLLQPCGPLEHTEQPQLLEAVKDTLRVDTYGEFLLDFAASNNVAYHMKHRPKDYTPSIHDAGAFISGLDVVLIDVDPEKIGDHATNLGHELRHHWQNITFADFYKEHNTDVDKVIRTRVIEADAYAVQYSIAYTLKQQGIEISWWESDPESKAGAFEQMCNQLMSQGHSQDSALNYVTGLYFGMGLFPESLDIYERKDAEIFERLNQEDNFPELIANSPYSQPEFWRQLTMIDEASYLSAMPENFFTDLREKLQKIGQSEYARPERKAFAQPLKFGSQPSGMV
jgi:hypothetical protein